MRTLSKSKLLAYRQCPKRLWLEVHHPELREDSASTEASFAVGDQVGDIARVLYDPKGKGHLVDREGEAYATAFSRSAALLNSSKPIFEAGFSAAGAAAFADVMLPAKQGGKQVWRMVEVKSSTEVKDYHRTDAAVQAFVARSAGVPLASIAIAHLDSTWVYPGGEDYRGLLEEHDLTDEVFAREAEVKTWIAEAQTIAGKRKEPVMRMGRHCGDPYPCGFQDYCESQAPKTKFPVSWLPRVSTKALKALIDDDGVIDMRKIPDALLNEQQLRVKAHSLTGQVYFDASGALADLAPHKLPAYFLDFETIMFAVPKWKGRRPYQMIPFQYSLHRLSRTGKLKQVGFLDLSGSDPAKAFAESLIAACGESGPVFVYNQSFETSRIAELAERFPRLKLPLLAINKRIVDLLPIARDRFYHPDQQGSWSIKQVLPAIVPDLDYEKLKGVQDGGMAMEAYLEAIAPETTKARKTQIEQQLLQYCGLDTYALVRLWMFFTGRKNLVM